jgi:hypothetical protein
MAPVPVEQAQTPLFDQPRQLMMLDDAEMALQMAELAPGEQLPARKAPATETAQKRVPPPPMQYDDFLTQLSAAAALIMDRAECEALAREMLQRNELIPAATAA